MDKSGFTLIELLVVVAIIGVLASVVLVSLNAARERSRDAIRLAQAREIEKALQMYFANTGSYPTTSGAWRGHCSSYGGYSNIGTDAWIPNLAPEYIPVLPIDPKPGSGSQCYLYRSNGVDFKLLIHGSFETCSAGSCPLQDPYRTTQTTGAIYSEGAMMW